MFSRQNRQQQQQQQQPSRKQAQTIKKLIEELYKLTLSQCPGRIDESTPSKRYDKNQVLALVLSRLIKRIYLCGVEYARHLELLRDIRMQSNNGDFVLVLRTDGRIVAMSDEAEEHLEKSMRLLYAQSVNIFECLDQTDGENLRAILNASADPSEQEYRLLCKLSLPKGKRPSRLQLDVKTITMTGHFYSCDDSRTTPANERLFIARCAAIMSSKNGKSSSTRTGGLMDNDNNGNASFTLILNVDMSIDKVSSNLCNALGYTSGEMVGNWFGRYLVADDVHKLEAIRRRYQDTRQQSSSVTLEVLDVFTNCGESRLTFLFEIRATKERRSDTIKLAVIAQLIDPSLRSECARHIAIEQSRQPQVEEVNLARPTATSTSEDAIVADSPTLRNATEHLHTDTTYADCSQLSPHDESFSSDVAPVGFGDESWADLFDTDANQSFETSADLQCWASMYLDDILDERSSEELGDLFADCLSDAYFFEQCERKKFKK